MPQHHQHHIHIHATVILVKGPDIYVPPLTGKPDSSGLQFEVAY